MNALRRELTEILDNSGARRTPALRRSIRDDWLYATDLPGLCTGGIPGGILTGLTEAGWEYRIDGQWMQLRKPLKEPPEAWFSGPYGPEADCCLSILRRHPERMEKQDNALVFRLIKAGEEGPEAYEKTCAKLHGFFSERLREGAGLPDISLRYFGDSNTEGTENNADPTYRACGIPD